MKWTEVAMKWTEVAVGPSRGHWYCKCPPAPGWLVHPMPLPLSCPPSHLITLWFCCRFATRALPRVRWHDGPSVLCHGLGHGVAVGLGGSGGRGRPFGLMPPWPWYYDHTVVPRRRSREGVGITDLRSCDRSTMPMPPCYFRGWCREGVGITTQLFGGRFATRRCASALALRTLVPMFLCCLLGG